ncbi:hypothetical protein MO973_00035, partial [Paenibacillus sp. TRM 82003]|nr:hypothetical protein [Paenibacillus sp. TRM 82003]
MTRGVPPPVVAARARAVRPPVEAPDPRRPTVVTALLVVAPPPVVLPGAEQDDPRAPTVRAVTVPLPHVQRAQVARRAVARSGLGAVCATRRAAATAVRKGVPGRARPPATAHSAAAGSGTSVALRPAGNRVIGHGTTASRAVVQCAPRAPTGRGPGTTALRTAAAAPTVALRSAAAALAAPVVRVIAGSVVMTGLRVVRIAGSVV